MPRTKKPAGGQLAKGSRKIAIGAALRVARTKLGLSLTDVARDAKISISMLSRIEAGTRDDLRLSTAVALCRTLGLSLDEIAGL